jgi:putative phage-type endonuclease
MNENTDIQKNNLKKIKLFKKMPLFEQKSQEWLNSRANYLTASTIAAVLGIMGKAAKNNILIDKVSFGSKGSFTGSPATQWGNKFEEVANSIYSYRNNNIKIHEFGLITNSKYPILAVSPDGITKNKLIEIKCPISRVIDGTIKKEYYHQIQEQLAICEFDICDFVECKFEECTESQFWEDYYEINENIEKGIIIMIINDNTISLEYIYSDINLSESYDNMFNWYNTTKLSIINSNNIYITTYYWKLQKYNCQEVHRDNNWIINNYPIFEKFWLKVIKYRKIGIDNLIDKLNKKSKKRIYKDKQLISSLNFNKCIL